MSDNKFPNYLLPGSFLEKIEFVKPLVAKTLKNDLPSRDDDDILYTATWEQQADLSELSYLQFKSKLILGELSTPETISRSRRLLQEKHVELRGEKYEPRHRAEELMRNQIKMEF